MDQKNKDNNYNPMDQTKADIVSKMSQKQIKYNKRVLHLKNGCLYYYSQVPSDFKEDYYDSLRNAPKSGISLRNAKVISTEDKQTHQKKQFQVIFLRSDRFDFKDQASIQKMNQEKIKSTNNNPIMKNITEIEMVNYIKPMAKDQKFQENWNFTIIAPQHLNNVQKAVYIDTQINLWIEKLDKLITFLNNPTIHKFDPKKPSIIQSVNLDEDQAKDQQKQEENRTKFEELKRLKRQEDEQKKREEIRQILLEEEKQKKLIKEQEEAEQKRKKEEEKRRRLEIEQQIIQERLKKIETAWDFRLQKILQESCQNGNDFQQKIKNGISVYQLLGSFQQKAQELCQEIVDEFYLPMNMRKYKPLCYNDYDAEDYLELNYNDENSNLKIKISWPNYDDPSSTQFGQFMNKSQHLYYDDKKIKQLGHEFRAQNYIASNIIDLWKSKLLKNIFQLPIACVIQYKGVFCFVQSHNDKLQDESIVNGPTGDGEFRYQIDLQEDLKNISRSLNLKTHDFQFDPRYDSYPIHLSVFCEVHQKDTEKWEELNKLTNDGDVKFDKVYHIQTLAEIFPVDIDINSQQPTLFIKRMRQFIFK